MAERVFSDRYRIVRHLARGGMAEVYLAHDQLLDRPVALKVLFPEFASDRSFVERFRREARAAANLNHPNIVAIYDWGEESGTYFIVMEYVDGRTLRDVIRGDGPLLPTRAAEIGADIAAALAFAHRNGVVHRDVKPGNVMIAGLVKVTDFGIARAGDPGESLTQTGAVMGTATYFSPEQAQGKDIDPRSDVYSLGVVLYEMVTGRPPFTGDSPVAIAYQHVREQPVPPSQLNPDVPVAFEAIVLAAMAKDRNNRYSSADSLRADLLRFAQGRPVAAMSAGSPAATGASGATRITARGPGGAGAAGAAAAGAAGGAGGAGAARAGGAAGAAAAGAAAPTGVMPAARAGGGRGPGGPGRPGGAGRGGGTGGGQGGGGYAADGTRIMQQQTGMLAEDEYYDDDDRRPARTSTYIIILAVLLALLGGMLFLLARTLGVGGGSEVTVPNVVGDNQASATKKIQDAGLKVTVQTKPDDSNPAGKVTDQSPGSGSRLKRGRTVTITVSGGADQIAVPGVVGRKQQDAQDILENAGFAVTANATPNDSVAKGQVVDQNPKPNAQAAKGSTVTLSVSSGPDQAIVPSLFNVPEAEASKDLTDLGLKVDRTTANDPTVVAGRVIRTEPGGGTPVDKGSSVTMVVSIGPAATTTTPTTTPTLTTLFPPVSTTSPTNTTTPKSTTTTTFP